MERLTPRDDSPHARTFVQKLVPILEKIQRLVVKKLWSIIVLTTLATIGGMLAARAWGPEHRVTGENLTYAILITLGIVGYWIWPKKIRVMRRLCTLLLLGGSTILVIAFVLSLRASSWQLGEGWAGMGDYLLTALGWRWFISGAGLGVLLMVGPIVRSRRAAHKQAAAQTTATKPAATDQPAAPKPPLSANDQP